MSCFVCDASAVTLMNTDDSRKNFLSATRYSFQEIDNISPQEKYKHYSAWKGAMNELTTLR